MRVNIGPLTRLLLLGLLLSAAAIEIENDHQNQETPGHGDEEAGIDQTLQAEPNIPNTPNAPTVQDPRTLDAVDPSLRRMTRSLRSRRGNFEQRQANRADKKVYQPRSHLTQPKDLTESKSTNETDPTDATNPKDDPNDPYNSKDHPIQLIDRNLLRHLLEYDGSLPFHQTTFLCSHNAHANRAAAGSNFWNLFGINQDYSIYDQLQRFGVRSLLIDVEYKSYYSYNFYGSSEPLRLVHGPLDFGGFEETMEENLIPFLEEDDSAVIMIGMETNGESEDYDYVLRSLQSAFSSLTVNDVPLKEMTFKYDHSLWANHREWPTIDEIVQSGQRLFVFTDRGEIADREYGIMHDRSAMMENYWEGIEDCVARYEWGNPNVSLPSSDNAYENWRNWSRLFLMNHFFNGALTVLLPRVNMCMRNNGGTKPNFIALDWVARNQGALEVIRRLNSVLKYINERPPTNRPSNRPTRRPTPRPNLPLRRRRPTRRPTPNPVRLPRKRPGSNQKDGRSQEESTERDDQG